MTKRPTTTFDDELISPTHTVPRESLGEPIVTVERKDRKTPDEWRAIKLTRASHYACARQLHGWRLHEHHQGAPIQITEAAYDEAIKAGQQMPCTPSPNAVSPHLGKGL